MLNFYIFGWYSGSLHQSKTTIKLETVQFFVSEQTHKAAGDEIIIST